MRTTFVALALRTSDDRVPTRRERIREMSDGFSGQKR
jgi:hypothetical protein